MQTVDVDDVGVATPLSPANVVGVSSEKPKPPIDVVQPKVEPPVARVTSRALRQLFKSRSATAVEEPPATGLTLSEEQGRTSAWPSGHVGLIALCAIALCATPGTVGVKQQSVVLSMLPMPKGKATRLPPGGSRGSGVARVEVLVSYRRRRNEGAHA